MSTKARELAQFAKCACRPCRDRPFDGRIFLCYRHDDSPMATAYVERALIREFGRDKVFRDIRNIHPGEDYRHAIRRELESCYAVLAVIGPTWLTMTDESGCRRIDKPEDPVREELELALELETRVRLIPVRVDGAKMPRASQLPPSLTRFAYRIAEDLPPGDFEHATEQLIARLESPRRSRFSSWTDIRGNAPTWALIVNALWRPLWANALLPVAMIAAAFVIPGALWLALLAVVLYLALTCTTLFDLQQARCVHECLDLVRGEGISESPPAAVPPAA